MSWSVHFIGHAQNVVRALKAESTRLSGPSKEEYDQALPHLCALVSGNAGPTVDLRANGHATLKDGVRVYGITSVRLTQSSAQFV